MSGKTIIVLATLDTKGPEAQYLREQIEVLGDKRRPSLSSAPVLSLCVRPACSLKGGQA